VVIATAVCLLFVAVIVVFFFQSRAAMQQFQCTENLKNIGNALHAYHDYRGGLPSTTTSSGHDISWRVHLWKEVAVNELAAYDPQQPFDTPQNIAAAGRITAFYCPLAGTPQGHTSYQAVFSNAGAAQQTCFVKNQRLRLADITDGFSNTIFVVEASQHAPQIRWNAPSDLQLQRMELTVNNIAHAPGVAGRHGGWQPVSAPVVAVDCSVVFLNNDIDPELLRKLLLRNDGGKAEFPETR